MSLALSELGTSSLSGEVLSVALPSLPLSLSVSQGKSPAPLDALFSSCCHGDPEAMVKQPSFPGRWAGCGAAGRSVVGENSTSPLFSDRRVSVYMTIQQRPILWTVSRRVLPCSGNCEGTVAQSGLP